jgi:hypothetical protein
MATPNSASTAYASPDDLVPRVDLRFLVQIASDTDVPIVDVRTATPAQIKAALNSNQRILTALSDAAGELESSLVVGGLYDPSDLQSLTGNSQSRLIRLNCDLAVGLLWESRPGVGVEPAQCQRAREALERLEKGKNVLGIKENQRAGVLDLFVEQANNVQRRFGKTVEARPLFSRRNNQWRPGEGFFTD